MNNFKKKSILTVAMSSILLASPVSSAFAADENAPFDGAYIGGAAILNKSNTNASVMPTASMTLNSKQKAGGGIYGGFGKQIDMLYLGAEGGFYINRNPGPTASFGGTVAGLKSKNSIDLSARAGFVADRALFYGLAGYTSTNFETIGLASKTNNRLNGFRYGGGIEFAVTPEVSLRGEYTHANYQSWDVASGANTISFDPSEHRFLVGASLRF